MDPELIKEWQVKINKISHFLPVCALSRDSLTMDVIKTVQYPQDNISVRHLAPCPTVLWSGLSQNVAMIENIEANMGLLMSQPSISIPIPQQKCPTVMKAIHYIPTQYASISIQVHSPLMTAIETGPLECDQVASTLSSTISQRATDLIII